MLNPIFEKLRKREPFALVRFGDGEYNILQKIACKRKGFVYNPRKKKDQQFRVELEAALTYNGGKNYFVGICNDKVEPAHTWLKQRAKGTMIPADIFVNKNYLQFLSLYLPLFKGAIIVLNEKANVQNLPFKCNYAIPIKDSAWRYSDVGYDWVKTLLFWLHCQDRPQVILVAGGAYSCTLIHRLWKENPKHIYIDIGSTLDPFIFGKYTRQYHKRLKDYHVN